MGNEATPPKEQDIVVTGSRHKEWGYTIDITDRGTGETERRWINDRREKLKLDNAPNFVETDIAAGATLEVRGHAQADLISARVEADSATKVTVSGGDGDDTLAATTLHADRPVIAGASRPEVNFDGGAGERDTAIIAGADAGRVVIQRTGEHSYNVTDGTGTHYNLTNVEYLRGRTPQQATPAPAAASMERTSDTSYRVTTADGAKTDYDLSKYVPPGGKLPELPPSLEHRGPALPADARGVNLDQLDLPVGEGMTLAQAQKPRFDPSATLEQALRTAYINGDDWKTASSIKLDHREVPRETLGNVELQTVRGSIEKTRDTAVGGRH